MVPMLFLFCVALYFTLRGASYLVLSGSLSMCFFCHFGILITLLGEEGTGLCAYRSFVVNYAHVNLCHIFSSSWCQRLAATSACDSSWTFLFTFLLNKSLVRGGLQCSLVVSIMFLFDVLVGYFIWIYRFLTTAVSC